MRICFFNDISVLGGGEIWVLNACRHLQLAGHKVSVICPYGSPLHTACQEENIDHFTYFQINDLPFYDPIYHFLANRKIDILYCTVIGRICEAQVLGSIVARINSDNGTHKTALILKSGLPPMDGLTPEYYGFGSSFAISRLHVVSDNLKKSFLAWHPPISKESIEVVYEGVDLKRYAKDESSKKKDRKLLNIREDYKIVACVARLHSMKGQDNLILAIPEVLAVFPKTIFLIVGDGEDKDRLEQLCRHFNLENAVRFTGHIENVYPILNASDILCHPSLGDGIPNSVVEAMAMSLPVIASEVGGIPEIIKHDSSGILISPHDIGGIASSLIRLLGDDRLCTVLGSRARASIAEEFDIKKNLDKLVTRLQEEVKDIYLGKNDAAVQSTPPPPVPVLFLFNFLRMGGEETEIGVLARYLDRKRFNLSVLTCWKTDEVAPVLEKLDALGIAVDNTCHGVQDDGEKIRYILDKIRSENIRIVVGCQDTRLAYNVFAHLSPSQCRLIEHGGIVAEAAAIPKDYTARYIGVSKHIRDAAANHMNNRNHALFIPSMVDTDLYENLNRRSLRKGFGFREEACIIAFVGRLDPKKRVELIIKAGENILPDFPTVVFLIIGGHDTYQPEYASQLVEQAKQLTETQRFIFTGPRGDVPELLTASDILVLPAIGEGMSHVINEAGAAGLAVVVTNDGAAKAQLEAGRCGRLVPPEDPFGLIPALRDLIENKNQRKQLGERLKAKVTAEYSAMAIVPQWESLLAEVAEDTFSLSHLRLINPDRTIPFPREIQLQTTTYCNASCVMCPHSEVSKEVSQGYMEESLLKKILAECQSESGLSRIEPFLMNEPFVDKRLLDWLPTIKNSLPNVMLTLTTNGALVTPEVSDRLISSGLDAIWFSFNGASKETYEKIMGISYSNVKSNIEYLLSIRPSNFQVFINMIETKLMKSEIEENIRYWQSLGVQSGTSPFVNRAGNVTNFDELNYTHMNKRPIRLCELVFNKMFILYNGDVVLCCMDWRRNVVLGNLYNESIKDIWHGDRYRRIRDFHVQGRLDKEKLCSDCSYTLR